MRLTPLASTRKTYWHDSRAPRYSLTFALPLLLLYEGLALVLQGPAGGVRNGADVLIKWLFTATLGYRGPLVFGIVLMVAFVVLVIRDVRTNGNIKGKTLAAMFVESVVLAVMFGIIVGVLTQQLLDPFQRVALIQGSGGVSVLSTPTAFMVSLGAGLYEELLFRVLLVGALLVASKKLLGWGPHASGTFAVLAGALIFSWFHYIGAYGDPFTVASFTFRAIAGVAFSVLYVLRGFGITAWTHAIYDVLLLATQ